MCGRPAHIVFILRTISAKHKYEINIGAWSVLSILVSRIHKHINGKRGDFLAYGEEEKESSKIWRNKPNFLQNKVHRETEGTEIKAIARRYWRHTERRRHSVQILDNFWNKCLGHTSRTKLANKLRCSLHRQCLRDSYRFVSNNPPSSPYLRVTLFKSSKLRQLTYHSKCLKPLISNSFLPIS